MTSTWAPVPASSRATARPAKLAPQISTAQSRASAVRSAPRFVARRGMGADDREALAVLCGYPPTSPMSSTTTLTAPDDQANAKVVEGSDGLLLEIDGRIVPKYDATLHP